MRNCRRCGTVCVYAAIAGLVVIVILLQVYLASQVPEDAEVHGWHRHRIILQNVHEVSPDNHVDGVCELSHLATCTAKGGGPKAKIREAESGDIPSMPPLNVSEYVLLSMGIHVHQYSRGVSLVDIDGDGLDDLWIGGAPNRRSHAGGPSAWRNLGGGRFEIFDHLIPEEVDAVANWGAVWFDYDNDGDSDVLMVMGGYEGANPCPPVFLENQLSETGVASLADKSQNLGGTGRPRPWDKTKKMRGAGQRPSVPPESLVNIWWGASAADFDRDGFTDVLVTATNQLGYYDVVEWDEAPTWVPQPGVFPNGMRRPWVLFRNLGNGTFADVTQAVLPWSDKFYGELKNPVWLDVDGNGWPDIFMAGSPPLLFIYELATGRFREARAEIMWRGRQYEVAEELATAFHERLAFGVCAADFNQDGRDDLYLGYWRRHDVVLLGGPEGFLAAAVIVEKDLRGAPKVGHRGYHAMHEGLIREEASFMSMHKWENSMTVACGDLDADGFPDVLVGTGTPDWGHYDFALCNKGNTSEGWQGLARCEQNDPRDAAFARGGDTRTHGFAFGDLDGDGASEVVVATGGFALADQLMPETLTSMVEECKTCHLKCDSGHLAFRETWLTSKSEVDFREQLNKRATQANCSWPLPCPLRDGRASVTCDSRSGALVFSLPPHLAQVAKRRIASVRLQGLGGRRGSARDAIGARLQIMSGGAWRRHTVVRSAQGFNSQDSAWLPVVVGPNGTAHLKILWPSGRTSTMYILGGERTTVWEPDT